MTSPISSLSKGKKSPLGPRNSFGKRQMPFRMPNYSSSERILLNDIHGHLSSQSSGESSSDSPVATPQRNPLHHSVNGSPRDSVFSTFNGNKKPSPLGLVNSPNTGTFPSNVPSDLDLMSSMMQKITKLEKTNLFYSREIIEKDKRIKVLEEKNALMERSRKSGENESPSRVVELEARCLELKQQIYEMETFLADYGMIWVGEKSNPNSNKYLDEEELETSHATTTNGTLWKRESARPVNEFIPDFEAVIANVKDLNVLAGDGVSKVAQTVGGAKLKVTESIPLILYKNGMMMFSGPFRSYNEETAQRCLKDIMDGYFPSELQSRYPDGVPIEVTDRRFVTFEDPRLKEEFPGTGQLLGGEKQPSNLVNSGLQSSASERSSLLSQMSNFDSASSHTKDMVTSELPGPKLSLEQFVAKLPKSVVRNGKVIDVRGSIADQLTEGHASSSSAEVVETQVVQEMQERMTMPENERPPSARNVATLRVKSEDGDKTLLFKMKFKETIGDLRKYIDKKRPHRKTRYNIISTFPSQIYSDESKTLEECGLVPNANLCLRNIKTPKIAGRNSKI